MKEISLFLKENDIEIFTLKETWLKGLSSIFRIILLLAPLDETHLDGMRKLIKDDKLESTVINVLSLVKLQMYMWHQMTLEHVTEYVNPREIQRKLLFALLIRTIANVP